MQKLKIKGKVYEYPYQTVLIYDDDHALIKKLTKEEKTTIPQLLSKMIQDYANRTR